jgi:hypothetical protein
MRAISFARWGGGMWVRLGSLGWGLAVDRRATPWHPLFSERIGKTKAWHIGPWCVKVLRPVRAISGGQEFDLAGAAQDFAGYTPTPSSLMTDFSAPGGGGGFSGLNLSPGQATSVGPVGDMGGGGFNFSDISGYAKQALPFLQLGSAGLGAYTGIRGMQQAGQQQGFLTSAEKTAQSAAAPALAAGQQLLPAGTSALLGGNLPPALEATVNQWKNNWRTQLRQYAAKAGIPESTMMAQYEGIIESQAQELRAQLAQGMITSGTSALQPAIQASQVQGQMALHQGDTTTAAISNANAALAKLLAAQS